MFGPDDNLYVTSANTDEILRYNGTTGAFIDAFVTAGAGGLDRPTDPVFGPDGNLYVSTFNNGTVLRFNGTTGAFIDTFVATGSGGILTPVNLVFHTDGKLYVGDFSPSSNSVLRYNATTGGGLRHAG